MTADDCGCDRINCYALVAYLPDPLARFLDDLRRQLVPGCNPRAHVTLLPPRPLVDDAGALRHVQDYFCNVPPFELEAAEISVFPVTNVIYIELGAGRGKLCGIHEDLNCGAAGFRAPFPYHPHITIAQELAEDQIPAAADIARKAWAGYPYQRRFSVNELSFVQCTSQKTWLDLATVRLGQPVGVLR